MVCRRRREHRREEREEERHDFGRGGATRKWFRVRDTYGVEVAPGQNDVVILAVTAGIDMM